MPASSRLDLLRHTMNLSSPSLPGRGKGGPPVGTGVVCSCDEPRASSASGRPGPYSLQKSSADVTCVFVYKRVLDTTPPLNVGVSRSSYIPRNKRTTTWLLC